MKKTRNKFEKKLEGQLKRSKVQFSYETEKIPYVLASHYIPDFILATPLGKIYIEAKGYLRPEDKRKLKAVKRQHPELDIRLVFYKDVKKQVLWAIKSGFRYSITKIPTEWIRGL